MIITCTFDTDTHKVVSIELINAIEKLVKCRGRYHTQQNFELLQSAFAKHQAATPYPADESPTKRIEELEKGLRDIANWTKRWASPSHPIAIVADRLLAAPKEE